MSLDDPELAKWCPKFWFHDPNNFPLLEWKLEQYIIRNGGHKADVNCVLYLRLFLIRDHECFSMVFRNLVLLTDFMLDHALENSAH